MMSKQPSSDRGSAPIVFEGHTRSLEAIVEVPEARDSVSVSAVVESGGAETKSIEQPQVLARVLTPGVVRVKLKFARNAPPRKYTGRIRLDDIEFRFVAPLQAIPLLQLSPPTLALSGVAEGEDSADLTVVNSGNAPFSIRSAYTFGVFQLGGLEEALGKAYREPGPAGERWIDRLGDRLTEAHGGLVRVKVERGEGPIEPGEIRSLHLRFRFPNNLRHNRVYEGNLEFESFVCGVEIHIPRATPRNS